MVCMSYGMFARWNSTLSWFGIKTCFVCNTTLDASGLVSSFFQTMDTTTQLAESTTRIQNLHQVEKVASFYHIVKTLYSLTRIETGTFGWNSRRCTGDSERWQQARRRHFQGSPRPCAWIWSFSSTLFFACQCMYYVYMILRWKLMIDHAWQDIQLALRDNVRFLRKTGSIAMSTTKSIPFRATVAGQQKELEVWTAAVETIHQRVEELKRIAHEQQ